jgi:outer membrane biosynthesis protein TonB
MPEMMILHAAKSWQFDPALREGHPVRYRVVISWTATP